MKTIVPAKKERLCFSKAMCLKAEIRQSFRSGGRSVGCGDAEIRSLCTLTESSYSFVICLVKRRNIRCAVPPPWRKPLLSLPAFFLWFLEQNGRPADIPQNRLRCM